MAVAYLGGPQLWAQQSQYSKNPFLNAIQDLMPLMNLFTNYMQYKPFIDQYSNTSLSDLAPIIEKYLPDVIGKNGSINFKQLQTYLTDSDNPMEQKLASEILNIAKIRMQFSRAPFQWQMQALNNPALSSILNGQDILTKTINVLSNVKKFNAAIDKAKLPNYLKELLKQTAPKLFENPALLGVVMPYLTQQQSTTNQPQPDNSILQPLSQPSKTSNKDSSKKSAKSTNNVDGIGSLITSLGNLGA